MYFKLSSSVLQIAHFQLLNPFFPVLPIFPHLNFAHCSFQSPLTSPSSQYCCREKTNESAKMLMKMNWFLIVIDKVLLVFSRFHLFFFHSIPFILYPFYMDVALSVLTQSIYMSCSFFFKNLSINSVFQTKKKMNLYS